jgi:twinkle protein
MIDQDKSSFLGHESCEDCGSSDALARYDDGHSFCFVCEKYTPADGQEVGPEEATPEGFLKWRPVPLPARGITASTCQLAGYGVADYKGSTVQVADYRDDRGRLIAQKIKTADKQFQIIGNGRNLRCWQIHRHNGGGKRVPIFEGETDCLAWMNLYPK